MSIAFFDFRNIGKNTNIKIINNTNHELLIDNICTQINTKYGTQRDNNKHIAHDQKTYTIRENTSNYIYVFDNAIARKYNHDVYSDFIRETDYHNYLFVYSGPRGTLIDTDVTFIQNEKIPANIKLIYDKNIDANTYTLEYVLEIFQKYYVVVISNNGKSLTRFEPQNMLTYVYNYHKNSWSSKCISNLIDKINNTNIIYHAPNATLHMYLSSRLDTLKICHYTLFFLADRLPSELCNIIMDLLSILCKDANSKKDIAMMCIKDYDHQTHAYWNLRIFL